MSVTQPIMTDAQALRRELLAAINAGVDFGLPAPRDIHLDMSSITLDSAADLCGWADWFGHTETIPSTFGQPHPNLADPAQSDQWLTNIYFDWHGQRVHLTARDAITDEQRQHWIDSGWAARFAEPEPEPTPEPLHYLEPGSGDGDLSDVLACGLTVATSGTGYVEDEGKVTCQACRRAAQLDHSPECREQIEERPCRLDCPARGGR